MPDRQDALLTLRRGRRNPPCLGQERIVEPTEVNIQGRQIEPQIIA
jgi:hypothetical protein